MNWATVLSNALWVGLIAWLLGWRFRPTIEKLLERTTKAGPTGFEFSEVVQQQVQARVTAAPGELKQLPGIGRTPAIEMVERRIHDEVTHIPEHDRLDMAIRTLAQVTLERNFEQAYTHILGSQIQGLRRLNEVGSVTLADARAFWETYRQAHPDVYGNFSFEAWLQYLTARLFAKAENDRVEITPFGRDFLVYITSRGLTDQKPY